MNSPLISIITVVYNAVTHIEKTIESVINQDFYDKEYIVVDGYSTDGTQTILRKYSDVIDKMIIEKDNGIAEAFNKGLELANGEYIIFLNSGDCLFDSRVLSFVSSQIKAHKSPTILYGDCSLYDENQFFLRRVSVDYENLNVSRGGLLPHPTVFTNRNYFDNYGNFDVSFKIAMDFDWMIRGILKERVINMHAVITKVLAGGVSTQNHKLVVSEIIRALKKNNFIKTSFAELYLNIYFKLRHYVGNTLRAIKKIYAKFY
jgi:glycosyltransferase involved in cell wall biosynthesis